MGFPATPLPAARLKESEFSDFVPSSFIKLGDPSGTGSPRRTDCAISSLFETGSVAEADAVEGF
jgi:hypothetical protein